MVDLVRTYPIGKRDGSTPAAGEIGEVIQVNPGTVGDVTVTFDTPINAWTAGTNEITLGPGSWRLNFQASVYVTYVAALNVFGTVYLFNFTDSVNVSRSYAGFGGNQAAGTIAGHTVSNTVYLNLTSTKVFRLRLQINQSAAGATAQLYGNNSPSGSGNLLQTNIIAERVR